MLLPLFKGQFIQTNPLPIKTAMEWSGLMQASFRLPLCPMDESEKNTWKSIYTELLSRIALEKSR
jgi:4-hydroxy-tetrahydrodipicolinate synthase